MDVFEREARAAAALNHPNICTVHCVGEQDGRSFISMELLEGETLEAILNRREVSIDEVLAIASQIAAAMDAAHSRGIVYRDIKPRRPLLDAQPIGSHMSIPAHLVGMDVIPAYRKLGRETAATQRWPVNFNRTATDDRGFTSTSAVAVT